jgi:hypothetical protein
MIFIAGLVADMAVAVPELKEDNIWTDDQEVRSEVRSNGYDIFNDRFGGSRAEI